MPENSFSISSNNTTSILPFIFDPPEIIDSREEYNKSEYEIPINEISQIYNNLNNLSFLIDKFDELREKEINGNITSFEQILLHEVIEKKILDLPNSHLPSDHEEAISAINNFQMLKRQYNPKKLSRLFNLFSWLG